MRHLSKYCASGLLVLAIVTTACTQGQQTEAGLPYMATLTKDPGAVAGVGLGGTLDERNGCVVLIDGDKLVLPVFPDGYQLTTESDGRIAIIDSSGRDVGSLGQDF